MSVRRRRTVVLDSGDKAGSSARWCALMLVVTLVTVSAVGPVTADVRRDLARFARIIWADAQCIIDCAMAHPFPGDAYDECVSDCHARGIHYPDAYGDVFAPVYPEGMPLQVREAVGWAQEIQAARVESADPLDLAVELRAFLKADWDNEIRTQFVAPYFIACVREVATGDHQSPDAIDAMHDVVLSLVFERAFDGTSETGIGLLALASWLALPDERGEVDWLVDSGSRDSVDELVGVLGIRPTANHVEAVVESDAVATPSILSRNTESGPFPAVCGVSDSEE